MNESYLTDFSSFEENQFIYFFNDDKIDNENYNEKLIISISLIFEKKLFNKIKK